MRKIIAVTRKLLHTIEQTAGVLACLQWAYLMAVFGYAKWGWIGGVLGVVSSPALLPFSPFTAWMLDPREAVIVFYVLIGFYLGAMVAVRLTEPVARDESGRRVM